MFRCLRCGAPVSPGYSACQVCRLPLPPSIHRYAQYHKQTQQSVQKPLYSVTPLLEKRKKSDLKYTLNPGTLYIVNEAKPKTSFEMFCDMVFHNHYGLCISRMHPGDIKRKYKLLTTPTLWLTTKERCTLCINPVEIGRMCNIIENFYNSVSHGIVLIDGIEYIILHNNFQNVLKILQRIRDYAVASNGIIIIPLEISSLTPKEVTYLEREAEVFVPHSMKDSMIDEIFLIYNDGRLILHETRRLSPEMDDDIVSSMFTAIQEFISTTMGDGKDKLKKLEMGNKKIIIERGNYTFMAIVVEGDEPKGLRKKMRLSIEVIEDEYGEILREWDGNVSLLGDLRKFVKVLVFGG